MTITELLRVGTVGAASTPLATTPALRLSFVGDVHRGRSQDSLILGNYDADRATASSTYTADATDNDDDDDDDGDDGDDNDNEEEDSTLPPLLVVPSIRGSVLEPQSVPHSAAMTDATRSSYMTNDTAASRISGLSDFPLPPNQTVVSLDLARPRRGPQVLLCRRRARAGARARAGGGGQPKGVADRWPLWDRRPSGCDGDAT